MKYYLVNYIIFNNRTVTENEHIGIVLETFSGIEGFKKYIAEEKNMEAEIECIVIKSYQQISREAFISLHSATV